MTSRAIGPPSAPVCSRPASCLRTDARTSRAKGGNGQETVPVAAGGVNRHRLLLVQSLPASQGRCNKRPGSVFPLFQPWWCASVLPPPALRSRQRSRPRSRCARGRLPCPPLPCWVGPAPKTRQSAEPPASSSSSCLHGKPPLGVGLFIFANSTRLTSCFPHFLTFFL